jgi:hypothetical protein
MDNWEEKARVCRLVSCRIRRSQKRWFLVLGVRLIDLLYHHPSVFGRWGMGFSSQRPYYDMMTADMYQPSLLNSFSPSLLPPYSLLPYSLTTSFFLQYVQANQRDGGTQEQ